MRKSPAGAFMLLIAASLATPLASFAEHPVVEARGRWLEGAAGVQASGLAVGSDNSLWTIGDDGTPTAIRLFKINLTEVGAKLGIQFPIGLDGSWDLSDFEDLCRFEGSTFLAVTERTPKIPQLAELTDHGTKLHSWSINLPTHKDENDNERLEGVAWSGKEIFLAYQFPPRIYVHSVTSLDAFRKATDFRPAPLRVDLKSFGIHSLSSLSYQKDGQTEYLLALDPVNHLLLRLPLTRAASGSADIGVPTTTKLRFLSPEPRRELCEVKPEGVTVRDGRLWIITDPNGQEKFTKPGRGCDEKPSDDHFSQRVPILFDLDLSDTLQPAPALRPPPAPLTLVLSGNSSTGSSNSLYETLRRKIESAGRQGKLRELEDLIDQIDQETSRPTPREGTSCWHLLKATALVDLGRQRDAKAMFRALTDTCPLWEAFNNLAVLEAADGDFNSARLNLCEAIQRAQPEEVNLPERNLQSLHLEADQPSLILAGYAKACPHADCSLPKPAPQDLCKGTPR